MSTQSKKMWREKHPLLDQIQRMKDRVSYKLKHKHSTMCADEWAETLRRYEIAKNDYNIVKRLEATYFKR